MLMLFKKGYKFNFVDHNNVILGYDTESSCCENADWFIIDSLNDISGDYDDMPSQNLELELPDFHFDTTYKPNYITEKFKYKPDYMDDEEYQEDIKDGENYNSLDEGDAVAFRLVSNDDREKFIVIYNAHNGYYSHGFEYKIDENNIEENYL